MKNSQSAGWGSGRFAIIEILPSPAATFSDNTTGLLIGLLAGKGYVVIFKALVMAFCVVVAHKLPQGDHEGGLADPKPFVAGRLTHGPHTTLSGGVHFGGANCHFNMFQTDIFQLGVDFIIEYFVIVVYNLVAVHQLEFVVEVQIPDRPANPLTGGVFGGACDQQLFGFPMAEEENIQSGAAPVGENLLGEEVHSPDLSRVFDMVPITFSLRGWGNAMAFADTPNGGWRAQFEQSVGCIGNGLITFAGIFPDEFQNKALEAFLQKRPTFGLGLAVMGKVVLLGDELSVPHSDRVGFELGDEVFQPSCGQTKGQNGELSPLFIIQSQLWNALAVDPQQGSLKKDQGRGHGVEIGQKKNRKAQEEVRFGENMLEDNFPFHKEHNNSYISLNTSCRIF